MSSLPLRKSFKKESTIEESIHRFLVKTNSLIGGSSVENSKFGSSSTSGVLRVILSVLICLGCAFVCFVYLIHNILTVFYLHVITSKNEIDISVKIHKSKRCQRDAEEHIKGIKIGFGITIQRHL